ncbi:hypothetical protein EON69_00100 [bacterium]|nr:MAG: hypothetical protein EON69_00100 [bacterium]
MEITGEILYFWPGRAVVFIILQISEVIVKAPVLFLRCTRPRSILTFRFLGIFLGLNVPITTDLLVFLGITRSVVSRPRTVILIPIIKVFSRLAFRTGLLTIDFHI